MDYTTLDLAELRRLTDAGDGEASAELGRRMRADRDAERELRERAERGDVDAGVELGRRRAANKPRKAGQVQHEMWAALCVAAECSAEDLHASMDKRDRDRLASASHELARAAELEERAARLRAGAERILAGEDGGEPVSAEVRRVWAAMLAV